jgi:multidrug efflux system membrane fusion protein
VITTGANEAGRVEVTSGLAAGERVVVDGMDRLREGAKIEIIEAGQQGRGARGGKPDSGEKGSGGRRPQRAPQ